MCAPANGRRYEPMPHGACDGGVQGGGGPVKQGTSKGTSQETDQARDQQGTSSQENRSKPGSQRPWNPRCCQRGIRIPSPGVFTSGDAPQAHVRGLEFTVRAWHGISASYVFFPSAFFPRRSALASARPRRHGFGIVWGLIVPGPSTDATGLNAAFARLVWVQLWQGLDLTLKVSLTGSRTRSLPSSSRQHVPLGLPGQVIRRQSQSQSSRYYVACQSDP